MLRSVVRLHLAPLSECPGQRGCGAGAARPAEWPGARLSNFYRTSVSYRSGTLGSVSIHVRSTAKGRRYDVKVRSADGTQHSKTFATRREATEYQSRQVAALADGIFIAPRAGATTVADLAVRWLASGTKRDSTRVRDRSIVMNHVLPGLGPTRAVGKLTRADCQALVDLWQSQGQAPRTVSRQRATLRAMLQHAVDADLIARNPAVGLKVPSSDEVDRPTLTSEQLEALATELARFALGRDGRADRAFVGLSLRDGPSVRSD
jgi:hypothetical protein